MDNVLLSLTHEQQQQAVERIQQQAVERIQQLMQQGMSSGEAIAQVAKALREQHQSEHIQTVLKEKE